VQIRGQSGFRTMEAIRRAPGGGALLPPKKKPPGGGGFFCFLLAQGRIRGTLKASVLHADGDDGSPSPRD
jgi:hypothetical protein